MRTWTASNGQSYTISDACDLSHPDTIRNLEASVTELEGRSLAEAFGGDAPPLDVVKFTRWYPDTCDCQLIYLWRKDHDEDIREHHSHRARRKCASHAHHDHHEHFHAVVAHNRQHNNKVH